jgi:hypothetical protein
MIELKNLAGTEMDSDGSVGKVRSCPLAHLQLSSSIAGAGRLGRFGSTTFLNAFQARVRRSVGTLLRDWARWSDLRRGFPHRSGHDAERRQVEQQARDVTEVIRLVVHQWNVSKSV